MKSASALMNGSPQNTHALVIGIGRYAAGDDWDLPAAVPDALRMTEWLIGRGVPRNQIELFLSRAPENAGIVPPADVAVHPATRDAIDQQAIRTRLREKHGGLLWIYWAGHGFLQRDGSRRLLYADASKDNQVNLDVDELLAFLQTDYLPDFAWNRQVLIADACANFASHEQWPFALPRDELPGGQEVIGREQFALFATRPGQRAEEAVVSRKGLVTDELLRLLETSPAGPWPPNLPDLSNRLIARFEALSEAGEAQQVPSYYACRDWGGNRIRIERGLGRTPGESPGRRRVWPDLTDQGRERLVKALLSVDGFADVRVRERLAGATELDQVRWEDSARGYAAVLIDAACACEWGMAALMEGVAAVLPSAVLELARCMDEEIPLASMNWAQLAELLNLVAGGLCVPADEADQELRRCGETIPPARRELRFRRALQVLALRSRCDDGSHPLLGYLEQCRSHFPPGISTMKFDQWESLWAAALNLDLDGARRQAGRPRAVTTGSTAGATAAEPPLAVLQLKVAPEGLGETTTLAGAAAYRITAWLVVNGRAVEPSSLPREKRITGGQLPAEVVAAVCESLHLLEVSDASAASLRVEGFLPLDLLDQDLDSVPIAVGPRQKRPIGARYPFVCRSYDRFYGDEYLESRAELRRRWALTNLPLADQRIVWARSAAECSSQLSTRFERGALAFVALELPPDPSAPVRHDVFEELIGWGVPLAVVLRGHRDPAKATDQELQQRLLADPPSKWPDKACELRQAEQLERLACTGLTLLWDDPTSLPPDLKRRLHQPV